MPSLDNNNDIGINISTTADGSGIDDATNKLGGMVSGFQDGMNKIAKVTGVAGAALTVFSKSSVNYLQDLVGASKKLSLQTGDTIENSSKLIAVVGRLGISADNASVIFRNFSRQIATARDGTEANALQTEQLRNKIEATKLQITQYTDTINKNGDSTGLLKNKVASLNLELKGYQQSLTATTGPLDKLGVSTQNADGSNRSFNDILMNVADKFKTMPDGATKTAIALQLFGRSGTDMIKVLDKGSAGIKDLEDQAQKLGLTLTAQNIGTIANYTASQKKLADSTNSLKIQVGQLTAPILTQFNVTLNDMLLKLIATDSPFRNLTAGVLAYGGPILGAVAGTASFLANVDQAIPAIVKFGEVLKLGAAFDAIKVGFATLQLVQIPSLIATMSTASGAFMVMFPVAGILADIALVTKAINAVSQAISDTNAAARSADNAGNAQTQTHRELLDLQKNGDAGQKSRATALLKQGYASGTNNASPGWHPVGENGMEMIKFNGGEQVKDASATSKMGGGGGAQFTIQQFIVQAPNNATVKTLLDSVDQDGLLASKGLTMRRGAA